MLLRHGLLQSINQLILDRVIVLDVVEVNIALLVEKNIRVAVDYFSLVVFLQLDHELVIELVPSAFVARQGGVVPTVQGATVEHDGEQII